MRQSKLGLMARGAGMGIAEVIPGVSGGTIAFITGIYHELINSIRAFDIELLVLLKKGRFREAATKIQLPFLLYLFSGMVAGIVFGIFFISHMLETYPTVLWAAFFALILASVPYMVGSLKSPSWRLIPIFLMAAMLAFIITGLTPVAPSEDYLYIFFGGVVAIVALVLPGISGSFILLLLGLYTLIIPTLKEFLSAPGFSEFKILFFFGLGCLTGLAFFSRLVSAAFELFHDATVAAMTGFMIGSLNKIWPWRNPVQLLDKDSGTLVAFDPVRDTELLKSGTYKILEESNVWPEAYYAEAYVLPVVLVFIISAVLVLTLSALARRF